MSTDSRRQCWECQRRRLVCDSTYPVCIQCRTTRITCPGYEDKRPLVWLAPGRVTSRTRRRPRKGAAAPSKLEVSKSGRAKTNEKQTQDLAVAPLTQAAVQDRVKIPKLVLKTERCDIYSAAHYYNEAIYPELVATELAPTWFVLPSIHLYIEVLPPSIRHTLIAMVFGHHILHRPCPPDMSFSNEDVRALHKHRLSAIQSLNADISDASRCRSDMTIKAVLMFLLQELGQCTLPSWREHLHGLLALFDLRGGLMEYIRTSQDTKVTMVSFFILTVFSNATSPAGQQTMPQEHLESIDTIRELYSKALYPNCPCPADIFTCIVRINHLRYQICQLGSTASQLAALQNSAEEVLGSLLAFRAEDWDWIKPGTSHLQDWLLVGRAFQSSAVLFLLHTLQAVFPAPRRRELHPQFAHHRQAVRRLLGESRPRPRARRGMVWPMVVDGVSAEADGALRAAIADGLERLSREQGSASPLQAKMVLQRFWDSGGRGWDECFDQPYALCI